MLTACETGGAARAAFAESSSARVFAAFESSCYVETPRGIACVGGAGLGRGPLNVIVTDWEKRAVGDLLRIDIASAPVWKPGTPRALRFTPDGRIPESIQREAKAFLGWLGGAGKPDDALIGRGPGLTPAGDDFVGGALIALRAFGYAGLADRVAAWALPLAQEKTSRISRAHLACAATGEGHEALHALLNSFENESDFERSLDVLSRVGHTSGLDAAAGALLALRTCCDATRRSLRLREKRAGTR